MAEDDLRRTVFDAQLETIKGLQQRVAALEMELAGEKKANALWAKGMESQCELMDGLKQKSRALDNALRKINEIRDSIVGLQTVNWSEHVYPLVAALNEAGFDGMGYPAAKEKFGTMLERTQAAESRVAELEATLAAVIESRDALERKVGTR